VLNVAAKAVTIETRELYGRPIAIVGGIPVTVDEEVFEKIVLVGGVNLTGTLEHDDFERHTSIRKRQFPSPAVDHGDECREMESGESHREPGHASAIHETTVSLVGSHELVCEDGHDSMFIEPGMECSSSDHLPCIVDQQSRTMLR